MDHRDVLQQIDAVQNYMKTHSQSLPNRLYEAMDGLSRVGLEILKTTKQPDWATAMKDATGAPLWSKEQAALLQELAPAALRQTGGGPNPIQLDGPSDYFKKVGEVPPLSIDKMVYDVRAYLAELDEKNKEIAQTVGPLAMIHGMKQDPQFGPIPPYIPFPIKIPAGTILPLLNAALEACRLLASNASGDSPTLRTILSLILGIFDILRGEWRDGVLSFLGVISQSWMMFGIVGKTTRWVYDFISPDIQERIFDDLYAGTKSMIIGFWLWILSVVSPDFVRNQINAMIETAKKPLEELNKQIEQIESTAQQTAAELGYQVTFPRIPLDKIPTLDEIQNFQSLLTNPELYCSTEFQTVLAPALSIPPLRIVLELLNIPTVPEKIAETCKDYPASIGEAITESMKPTVIPMKASEEEGEQEGENEAEEAPENQEPPKEEPKKGGRYRLTRRRRQRGSRKQTL